MTAPPAAPPYRGRFAPSPTGPLHLGSLVAALGSFLEARRRGGEWRLRIEDVDGPRNVPGAADAIRAELERLGLHWDGAVLLQSARIDRYHAALADLDRAGRVFRCACTRREVAGRPYPGTCRAGIAPGRTARSLRLRVDGARIALDDAVQGRFVQDLAREVGDFVVRRGDGVIAYHLAVAIDDAEQGMTDVVRGADLLESTPRQIHVMRALGLSPPRYAHLPVVLGPGGTKLSKQTGAEPTARRPAGDVLWCALALLGQRPPPVLRGAPPPEVLAWARAAWRLEAVPRRRALAGRGRPPARAEAGDGR